jgi:TRAP-type C4-dicarboxylate transport system substrate-binding protein
MLQRPELVKEYSANGLKVLYTIGPDLQVMATKDPISDVSKTAGLNLRTPGALAKPFQALGARPVSLGSDELYEALQRGVIDGLVTGSDTITSAKLQEVVRHSYDLGKIVGAFVTTPIVMNEDTWKGLQPQVQKIMQEVSADALAQISGLMEPSRAESCDILVKKTGFQPIGDSTGWAEKQSKVVLDQYAQGLKKATGQDPAGYLAEYKKIVDQETAKAADVPLSADDCLGYVK